LYKQSQNNECFSTIVKLGWAANGVYVSVINFVFVFYLIHGGEADSSAGHVFGLWEVGTQLYTGIVITVNLQMAQMINYWTWIHHACIWSSIAIWYACNIILSTTDPYWSTYSYTIFHTSVGPTSKYWAGIPLLVAAGLLPDLMYRGLRRALYPEYHHLVQEHEAKHRGRGESKGVSAPGAETGDLESGGGGDDGASPPRRERDDRLARGGVVGVGVGVGVTASPVKPGTLTGATPDPSSAHHTPREETTSLKDYLDQVARGAEEDPDDEGFAWRPRPTRETGSRPPSQFSSRPSSRPPSGGVN
jgi:hypothetical protein